MKELVSSASQPLDDGSQPPQVDIDTLYFETAGGEKKRRVYGLGSRAASIYPSSYQSTGSSHSSASAARVREIVQQKLANKKAEIVTPRPDELHSTCNCKGAYVNQVPL